MSIAPNANHYEVLELRETATLAEIRKAYRKKALRHHPDKNSTEQATCVFQRIQEAYEVLGNARDRMIYDARNRNEARNEVAKVRAEQEREMYRSNLQDRLIEACKAGETFKTMKLLRGGCSGDINAFDEAGHTPLMHASIGMFSQVVSLLFLYNADVNLANVAGWTALTLLVDSDLQKTASNGGSSCPTLLELLRAQANPNAQTNTGITALLLAAASGNLSFVEALLEHAAEPDIADHIGTTPLILAADSGHVEVVRALLGAGASVDFADKDGRTASMSASSHAHKNVVSVLLDGRADPCAKALDGCSVLLFAMDCLLDDDLAVDHSKKGSALAIARLLLEARALPEDAADDGRTPMGLALQIQDSDVTSLLSKGRVDHCHEIPDANRVMELGG